MQASKASEISNYVDLPDPPYPVSCVREGNVAASKRAPSHRHAHRRERGEITRCQIIIIFSLPAVLPVCLPGNLNDASLGVDLSRICATATDKRRLNRWKRKVKKSPSAPLFDVTSTVAPQGKMKASRPLHPSSLTGDRFRSLHRNEISN